MDTRSDEIEVGRAVIARTRVALCGARSLEIDFRETIGSAITRAILTFDEKALSLKHNLYIGTIFVTHARAPFDTGQATKSLDQMLLCHRPPDRDLKHSALSDEVENPGLWQLKLPCERVKPLSRWERGLQEPRRDGRQAPIGQMVCNVLTLARCFPKSLSLEPDEPEEMLAAPSDQHFEERVIVATARPRSPLLFRIG